MSSKKPFDAAAAVAYRASTEQRRARRHKNNDLAKMSAHVEPSHPESNGVLTVRKLPNTKSVSSLGGPTKAFGVSKFAIPEFRRIAKRSPR